MTTYQEYNNALALVNVNKTDTHQGGDTDSPPSQERQPTEGKGNRDLQRAREFVDLHYDVKERHGHGVVDEDLARLRFDVNRVLQELS